MSIPVNASRRSFLRIAVLAGLAPGALMLAPAQAADAALPHVAADDSMAKTFGYVEDASKLDAKTEPTYKAGSACASCALFQGKAGDAYGPCAIFAGKAVSSKGWCKSYAKKGA